MSLMYNIHHYSSAAGIMKSWHAALETSFQYDSAHGATAFRIHFLMTKNLHLED